MLDIALSLSPRYRVSLTLVSKDGHGVSMQAAPADVLLLAAAVLRGQPGESGATARRHAYAAPQSYCARAIAGTLDSDPVWSITRITCAADGSTTAAHATGAWTDRAALIYT